MDRSTQDQLSLCFLSIGDVTLAFPSHYLESFIAGEFADNAQGLDLAEHLDLERGDDDRPLVGLLRYQRKERAVTLGSSIRLRSVPLQQLHPLPALVRGLQRTTGLKGVIVGAQSLALLIDFESLP